MCLLHMGRGRVRLLARCTAAVYRALGVCKQCAGSRSRRSLVGSVARRPQPHSKRGAAMPQHEHIERSVKLHGEEGGVQQQEACFFCMARRPLSPTHAPPPRPAPTPAGRRLDHEERKRKREARQVHKRAEVARTSIGLRGKMLTKKRHAEKAQMKKTIAMHEEKGKKRKADDGAPQNAVPAYLLEREQVRAGWLAAWGCRGLHGACGSRPGLHAGAHARGGGRGRAGAHARRSRTPAPCGCAARLVLLQVDRAKVLSNTIKQKRKEKAGKWEVPLPKVRPVAEQEMFKVLKSGKRQKKAWKRMVTKVRRRGPCTHARAGGPHAVRSHAALRSPAAPRHAAAARPSSPADDVRGPRLHAQAAQVRALHPAHGPAHHQGARDAPRAEGHVLPGHHRHQEEPQRPGARAGLVCAPAPCVPA